MSVSWFGYSPALDARKIVQFIHPPTVCVSVGESRSKIANHHDLRNGQQARVLISQDSCRFSSNPGVTIEGGDGFLTGCLL